MLKNQQNETKSEPSSRSSVTKQRSPKRLLLAIAIILFGLFILVNGIVGLFDSKSRLVAPSGVITIEIVDTPAERQLGLSGRSSIGENEGMMFVFETVSMNNCFWMKDMQFPIDMIWLDEDREVITVERSVEPISFPESFCPESSAKYGLEIQANRADELGIVPGETVRF